MTPLHLRDRLRRLPAGEVIVHVVVFVVGAALIGLGLALVVFPGPLTIPPVLLGLAVWALEFDFAQRWLDPWERKAQQAWQAAKEHPWQTAIVTGGGLLATIGLIVVALRMDVLDRVT